MLTCVSEGIPPPVVTFYFNGEEMKGDDMIIINDTSHILTITKVDTSHEGDYSCNATSVAGFMESNSVTVTVFGKWLCVVRVCVYVVRACVCMLCMCACVYIVVIVGLATIAILKFITKLIILLHYLQADSFS